jgi:hypothetical protein
MKELLFQLSTNCPVGLDGSYHFDGCLVEGQKGRIPLGETLLGSNRG